MRCAEMADREAEGIKPPCSVRHLTFWHGSGVLCRCSGVRLLPLLTRVLFLLCVPLCLCRLSRCDLGQVHERHQSVR